MAVVRWTNCFKNFCDVILVNYSLEPALQIVKEGEPMVMVCTSTSRATWFKDGYELDGAGGAMNILFIKSVKAIDQGQYTCTGTDSSNQPFKSDAKAWVVQGELNFATRSKLTMGSSFIVFVNCWYQQLSFGGAPV